MLLLISPLRRWVWQAQLWLLSHGYFWLGVHLPRVLSRAASWSFLALWVGEIGREIRLLWVFPARARKLATRGEMERAIHLMRRSVGAFTPLLGSKPLYFTRAFTLGQMLENARRHGEANDVWQQIARRTDLNPAFEAEIRNRWANGLEILGDLDGATRQRALVADRVAQVEVAGGADHWSILFQRAKSALAANQFADAQELFERALEAPKFGLIGSNRDALETEIACRIALAAFQNGDNARAESAARLVIAGSKNPFWLSQGYRTLALTLGTQNRLPEALEASRAALENAGKVGDADALSASRAQHAMLLKFTGQVKAALEECEAAAASSLNSSRQAWSMAVDCHLLRGDYAAARHALEQARLASPYADPAAERQTQALFNMEGAGIEMVATRRGGENRAQMAYDLLQSAKPGLQGFERLLFWLEAAEMLTLALLGQSETARARIEQVAARIPEFEGDPATLNAVWTWLAETHRVLGDWQQARDWWRIYLDAEMGRPVYRADATCDLGQCLRELGDEAGARECWQNVIGMNFDITATVRAQKFLSESLHTS